ncbi:MAG: DUF362 domain-containing protein [Gemmatimonadota bacterium]|nr:MAG: DUF362 domain-containing protein [Gemmatimonadota bacterium]
MRDWDRREFVEMSAMSLATLATGRLGWPAPSTATVGMVTVGAGGRDAAIRQAVELAGAPELSGKWVALKPNFNSAHAFPGSTHPETLESMVGLIKDLDAARITVADRSGMGDTRQVMEDLGVMQQAEALGFEALPLQDLPAEGWVKVDHADLHWSRGYHLGSIYRQTDAIVQTCCLKTHRFGGHFTLSLKNSVGMVAKQVPGIDHDFMRELHGSEHQRRMIAEINLSYQPAIVVMDAVECFTDRGPEAGTVERPNLVLASSDRVALDAVGVAILRDKETTSQVSDGPVFRLEQIERAVELGIGVANPDQIEIVTADSEAQQYAERLRAILA